MLGPVPAVSATGSFTSIVDTLGSGAPVVTLSSSVRGGMGLMLVDADKVGNQPTTGAVSIVFTPANAIPSGSTITINTP